MARLAAVTVASLAMAVVVSAQTLQKPRFVPPRLKTTELPAMPPLPAPTVSGGGEVVIEALVDRRGMVLRPAIVRATAPYTQFVLDALARWQFEPARDIDYKGLETVVDMPITVVALYRPPILMNAATVGEAPKAWSKPSGDAPYPIATVMPNYPPRARAGGVVLFEVSLDEAGVITDARAIGSTQGFESASREALASWRFRGGSYRAKQVPSTAYVLFGFRSPVGLPSLSADEPSDPYTPKPIPDPYKPQPTPAEPYKPTPTPAEPYKPKPTPGEPYKPDPAPADPYKPKPTPDPYKPPPQPKSSPEKSGAAMSPKSFGILSFR
jgi:hypothetical protein